MTRSPARARIRFRFRVQMNSRVCIAAYSESKPRKQGSRSVGASRWHPVRRRRFGVSLGSFRPLGFKGLGCSRPPWPQALRKRYLRVQIGSTRLRSQISESSPGYVKIKLSAMVLQYLLEAHSRKF